MDKTIHELRIDAEFADSMVLYWEATRDYHDSEKAKATLEYIKALADRTKAHNDLLAFEGAAS
jgi:hypothetical protein